ncbi:hypothetical protein A1359_09840 [Methylomonas lenta]|uniref:DUF4314 domain-containing protein n=1 Tax=Methylomonas lenta TaxID=980561 RepID=A0A177NAD3_9GAMM|nr:hypothetical protein [Methylomonas lenta]OAI15006.1 hypothetical protein A1359_09840 [Methylomonas lenta]
MFGSKIKLGSLVRPICDDVLPDVTRLSIGQIIMLKTVGFNSRDFYVTVRWDNGTETFLNAVFFVKTVEIIEDPLVDVR